MASKRTINRAYWTAVKALTLYRDALDGWTDRDLMTTLTRLEEALGQHKPAADLHNQNLWKARTTVDTIRKES